MVTRLPFIAQLIEIADHYHAIQHCLSEKRDKTDGRRNAQMDAREAEREDAPDQREWHVEQDQQRAPGRAEGVEEQREDQQHADRHNQRQPFHRPLLVFKLAAPGQVIPRRHLRLAAHPFFHLGHQTAHVAVANEDADGHYSRTHLAANVHAAGFDRDRRELVERDAPTRRRVHQNGLDVIHPALLFGQAHDDGELLLSLPDFGRLFAAERGFDHVLNVGDFQPIAGRIRAVNFYLQLWDLAVAVNERPRDAAHRRDGIQYFQRLLSQHVAVRAENLDDDLAVNL